MIFAINMTNGLIHLLSFSIDVTQETLFFMYRPTPTLARLVITRTFRMLGFIINGYYQDKKVLRSYITEK